MDSVLLSLDDEQEEEKYVAQWENDPRKTATMWPPSQKTTQVERETGLEPATICLEGRCATIALLPHRGRGDRIRTYDPRVPNAVRYQLRYTPTMCAVYPPPPRFVKVRSNRFHMELHPRA